MARPRDPDWSAVSRIWLVRERVAIDGKQALTPRLLDELPPMASPILVVGGGAGAIPVHLARAGHRVTSIDACPEMIALARERARSAGVDLVLVQSRGDVAPVRDRFATVIVSTGVITPESFDLPATLALYDRVRDWIAPGGTAVLAYCRETAQNLAYRSLYDELGLDRVRSNNRLFVGAGTLDDALARFHAEGEVDAAAIEKWFGASERLLAEQHLMIRSFEQELLRQGVDAEPFIAAQLGYQKPFLTAVEEEELVRRVSLHFLQVERRLLSDDETGALIARA